MAGRRAPVTRTSNPRGLNPPGTTRPVRGKPGTRAATDVPIEVPLHVYYKRHTLPDGNHDLVGWTVTMDMWLAGEQFDIKIFRNPTRYEVWIGGKKVKSWAGTGPQDRSQPPMTVPDEYEEPVLTAAEKKKYAHAVEDQHRVGKPKKGWTRADADEEDDEDDFEEF